jgi:hypothetical protein
MNYSNTGLEDRHKQLNTYFRVTGNRDNGRGSLVTNFPMAGAALED